MAIATDRQMDRDAMILAALLRNGRLPGPRLREETGIPKTPFYARLRYLREEGLVREGEGGAYELVLPEPPEEERREKALRPLGFWGHRRADRRLQFLERKAGQHALVRVAARVREALEAREPFDVNAIAAEEYVKSRREFLGEEEEN